MAWSYRFSGNFMVPKAGLIMCIEVKKHTEMAVCFFIAEMDDKRMRPWMLRITLKAGVRYQGEAKEYVWRCA